VPKTDEELLLEGLRAILAAPGASGKSLEAKASAARQLAALTGIGVELPANPSGVPDADPMADLDDLEALRRRRARK
jgi:hypothetical protein